MKKLNFILLVGFLQISILSFSQESRFIEIMISDTVSLKATQIVYQINIGSQTEYMEMDFSSDENKKEDVPSIKEISSLLDKGIFKYSIDDSKSYTISAKGNKQSIDVVLNNEIELKRLLETIKSEKGITGNIKEVVYESISTYQGVILKNLYTKATTKANMLASISGNSMGKLISISEMRNENDGFDFIKKLMQTMPKGMLKEPYAPEKMEVVKMVFKFEIK